jgi:hypothetical protein
MSPNEATAYSPRAHEFTTGFWWDPCCSSF